MGDLGKMIIGIGIVLIIVGSILTFVPGLPKLPGDILIRKGNFTFYFPIVTSIIISIILTLTLILNFFLRR